MKQQETIMVGRKASFGAAVILCLCGSDLSSRPVLWRVEDGGNGHYYELIRPDGGITWTAAKAAAEARSFLSVSGHLVTASERQEHEFLVDNFVGPLRNGRHGLGAWIGLSDRLTEGRFEWVTGERVNFTRWGSNEPNNAGDEDFVYYEGTEWNDFRDNRTAWDAYDFGYIVEYDVGLVYRRGDVNADGQLNVADPVLILDYLFGSASLPCLAAADSGGDGNVNVSDAVGLLGFLFLGTFPPPPPFEECGSGPEDSPLTCESFPACS